MTKVYEETFKASETGLKTDGFYIDEGLKKEFDLLKKAVKDDWDGVILIDGVEGGGKSILAQQLGYYLDPKLDSDNIVFSGEDFMKQATEMTEKYRVIIFDEAFAGLSSRAAMSQMNKKITGMLMEIRQKNLFLILILPTFFELDRYAAIFRSRCLIHVTAENFVRGSWEFYGYGKKKRLYMYGKKFYNYKMVHADIRGRFAAFSPVDSVKYKQKKTDSLCKAFNPEEPEERYSGVLESHKLNQIRNGLNNYKRLGLTKQGLCDVLGVSYDTLSRKTRKIRKIDGAILDTYKEGGESEEK
jgi:hypothetical protein